MIWLCMFILLIALGYQNKTISELQKDNEWLNFQQAFLEERIMRVEGEKVAQNSTKSDMN